MVDHLVDLYATVVEAFVLVVQPGVDSLVREHRASWPKPLSYGYQASPTGMLDAILAATEEVARLSADHVWITWCDQVGVLPSTIRKLHREWANRSCDILFPTVEQPRPYVHYARDEDGRIVRVLQRREGDPMPDVGESDIGLFVMSASVFSEDLPSFAKHARPGRQTSERNFLPFIAWMAERGAVATVAATDVREAIGVNTRADRELAERFLSDG
jgi:bifunctional N-acetylglucosamine-1-phosphate-uridyltransferase/glucosamine-1-phosphate-acetyltransferase GlmU-like protein